MNNEKDKLLYETLYETFGDEVKMNIHEAIYKSLIKYDSSTLLEKDKYHAIFEVILMSLVTLKTATSLSDAEFIYTVRFHLNGYLKQLETKEKLGVGENEKQS